MNRKETDVLQPIFSRMAEGEILPEGFREAMMRQILSENVRMQKRAELWQTILTLAASLAIAGITAGVFIYFKIPLPVIRISFPEAPTIPQPYLLFGALTLCLLVTDFFIRQAYYKKHPA